MPVQDIWDPPNLGFVASGKKFTLMLKRGKTYIRCQKKSHVVKKFTSDTTVSLFHDYIHDFLKEEKRIYAR